MASQRRFEVPSLPKPVSCENGDPLMNIGTPSALTLLQHACMKPLSKVKYRYLVQPIGNKA